LKQPEKGSVSSEGRILGGKKKKVIKKWRSSGEGTRGNAVGQLLGLKGQAIRKRRSPGKRPKEKKENEEPSLQHVAK